MKCDSCAKLDAQNDRLRDRCGTLELLNESVREKLVAAGALSDRQHIATAAVLETMDKLQRRIDLLTAENEDLRERVRTRVTRWYDSFVPWRRKERNKCPVLPGQISMFEETETVH